MTWNEKITLLEKELTFRHFFDVFCLDKTQTFAIWLEDDEVRTYDYQYLMDRSFAASENICRLGFGKKDGWTGLAVDTCKEWPILFWGLLSAGRKVLLLDPSLDDSGIDHLMKQAKADSLITRRKRVLLYQQCTPEEILGESAAPSADYQPDWADQIAACTSGTVSTSRVFVYDGAAICRQVIGFSHHQPYPCLTSEAFGPIRTVCFLPFNHIFGLLTNAITLPFQNDPQIFLRDRAPQTIFETCRKCGAHMILTVPLLVNSISDNIQKKIRNQSVFKRAVFQVMRYISLFCQYINPLWGMKVGKKLFHSVNANLFGDEMRQIVVGGAHVPEKHLKMINSLGYAVTIGFGMTETCITSYENKIDLKTRLSGSVGLPLPISEYRVLPDGSDPNRGELLTRSNAMHIGRLENGELLPPLIDSEGWYHTGDVVRLGKKDRMWIEGRIKDVIIGESGENVYPDEIEDVFAGMEGVEQFSVFGLKKDQQEKVALLLNIGGLISDSDYQARLLEEVEKRNRTLRSLKRIQLVFVTSDSLPVSSSLKIKRGAISKGIEEGTLHCRNLSASDSEAYSASTVESSSARSMSAAAQTENIRNAEEADRSAAGAFVKTSPLAAGVNGEDRSEALRPLIDRIKQVFSEELDISPEEIGDNTSFSADLGADSLDCLGALVKIENEFGVHVPEDVYQYCTTAAELAVILEKLTAGETAETSEK